MADPRAPTVSENITILKPKDWMQEFTNVFRNDTKYGFDNQQNPDRNIFKSYNVVESIPESIGQIPALWITCEGFMADEESGGSAIAFLNSFVTQVDVYIVVIKSTTAQYDDMTWRVPSSLDENPPNNIFSLLAEYVGQKLRDNPTIENVAGTITITPRAFLGGEYFYTGFRGIVDARALRLSFGLEVELD